MKPLLKWPGGKRNLLSAILQYVPERFNRYFEPFAGGAALFFQLSPKNATLSDLNGWLIECYREIRDNSGKVISVLETLRNSEKDYYWARDVWNPRLPHTRAARLLYLQRLSFNGIYRENLDGEFNVPYGYKHHVEVCDQAKILAAAKALQGTALINADYKSVMKQARAGDVVYVDPPYTVAHNNNGFIKYNANIFSWQNQIDLAQECSKLRLKGCKVIVTNAAHESVINLYDGAFEVIELSRYSVVAASSGDRRPTKEALLVSR